MLEQGEKRNILAKPNTTNYTEKKSYGTKPKMGFIHATKPLKELLVCNEIETLKQFIGCPIGVCKGFVACTKPFLDFLPHDFFSV
jgi:hypothetical protein